MDAVHLDGAVGEICPLADRQPPAQGVDLLLLAFGQVQKLAHLVRGLAALPPHQRGDVGKLLFASVDPGQRLAPGHRFDAAHASGDAFLGDDAQHADVAGAHHMGAAAEFHREAAAHGEQPHALAVLLAEQRHRAFLQRVREGGLLH